MNIVIPARGTSPVVPQNGTDKCHLVKMPRKPHTSVDNPLAWRFSPASDQQDQNSNEPPPPYPIIATAVTNYSPSIPNRQSPTSTTDGKHKIHSI